MIDKHLGGWQSIKSDRTLLLSLGMISLFLMMAILAPVIANENDGLIPFGAETAYSGTKIYQGPGFQEIVELKQLNHLLGTDQIGRDVASRLIHGTRTTLIVGVASTFISLLIALLLGSLSGYYGDNGLEMNVFAIILMLAVFIFGFTLLTYNRYIFNEGAVQFSIIRVVLIAATMVLSLRIVGRINKKWPNPSVKIPVDSFVMKIIEVVRGIPGLFLILAIFSVINYPSIWSIVIVIGLLRWGGMTRLLRAEIQRYHSESFVDSAQVLGLSDYRIITRHLLPVAAGPMIVSSCFMIGNAILIEASLSFLGIGVPTDSVSWGSMLSASRDYINAWWLAIFPGLLIFLMILSFNVVGDRLRKHLYMGIGAV